MWLGLGNRRGPSYSLRRRQMAATVWKRGLEKLARRRTTRRLGSRKTTGRCCGPKKRRASARIPYLSSVQCVCSSHRLFCSHQMAWSDQSCLRSVRTQGSLFHFCPSTDATGEPDWVGSKVMVEWLTSDSLHLFPEEPLTQNLPQPQSQ